MNEKGQRKDKDKDKERERERERKRKRGMIVQKRELRGVRTDRKKHTAVLLFAHSTRFGVDIIHREDIGATETNITVPARVLSDDGGPASFSRFQRMDGGMEFGRSGDGHCTITDSSWLSNNREKEDCAACRPRASRHRISTRSPYALLVGYQRWWCADFSWCCSNGFDVRADGWFGDKQAANNETEIEEN